MKSFKHFLIETSLPDFNVEEVFKIWMDEVKNYGNDSLPYEFKLQNKEFEDYTNEELYNNQEFFEYMKEYFYDSLYDFEFNIKTILIENNGYIPIFRMMTVDDEFFDNLHTTPTPHLGVYWSWDEGSAEAHWGEPNKPYTILIESIINKFDIDWDKTYRANLDINLGQDEKEIFVPENTPLKIIRIHNKTRKMDYDITNIKDIVYKA